METAASIVNLARWWVYTGLAVAAAFLALGLDRVDENARGAFLFRVLIIPGLVLLWPLVLWRWWLLETSREKLLSRHRPPRRQHGWVWSVLGAAIPAIFLGALILGAEPMGERDPVKLSEASQ